MLCFSPVCVVLCFSPVCVWCFVSVLILVGAAARHIFCLCVCAHPLCHIAAVWNRRAALIWAWVVSGNALDYRFLNAKESLYPWPPTPQEHDLLGPLRDPVTGVWSRSRHCTARCVYMGTSEAKSTYDGACNSEPLRYFFGSTGCESCLGVSPVCNGNYTGCCLTGDHRESWEVFRCPGCGFQLCQNCHFFLVWLQSAQVCVYKSFGRLCVVVGLSYL